eukprot:scaffold5357_cov208-Amphora_coffeaeformis.AAC.29
MYPIRRSTQRRQGVCITRYPAIVIICATTRRRRKRRLAHGAFVTGYHPQGLDGTSYLSSHGKFGPHGTTHGRLQSDPCHVTAGMQECPDSNNNNNNNNNNKNNSCSTHRRFVLKYATVTGRGLVDAYQIPDTADVYICMTSSNANKFENVDSPERQTVDTIVDSFWIEQDSSSTSSIILSNISLTELWYRFSGNTIVRGNTRKIIVLLDIGFFHDARPLSPQRLSRLLLLYHSPYPTRRWQSRPDFQMSYYLGGLSCGTTRHVYHLLPRWVKLWDYEARVPP